MNCFWYIFVGWWWMQITYQHGVFENHIFMVYNLELSSRSFVTSWKSACLNSTAPEVVLSSLWSRLWLWLQCWSSMSNPAIYCIFIYTQYTVYILCIYIYITSRLVHRIWLDFTWCHQFPAGKISIGFHLVVLLFKYTSFEGSLHSVHGGQLDNQFSRSNSNTMTE